jgi:hypothetical protein
MADDKKTDKPDPKPPEKTDPKPKPKPPKAAKEPKAGEMAVVLNPAARCVNIVGIGLMKPGRNLVQRSLVESPRAKKTLAQRTVKQLGIGVVAPGKPEKMAEEEAAKIVADTFVIEDLEAMLEQEKRESVRDAIKKQIALIRDVKKPEGDPSGTAK